MMHGMRGKLTAIGCTAALALLGCRVGGGPTDGETGDDTSDGSTTTDTGTHADSSGGSSNPDTGSQSGDDSGGGGGDATTQGDGGGSSDAHSDAHLSDGGSDAPIIGPPVEAGTCTPTFSPVTCDPVCNTGCSGLTRCDVFDTMNTGSCIGIWIQGEGTACLPKTATTDPCAPSLTCVNGVCVKMCWQNSDCPTAGTCCNTTVPTSGGSPSGFKSCGACP